MANPAPDVKQIFQPPRKPPQVMPRQRLRDVPENYGPASPKLGPLPATRRRRPAAGPVTRPPFEVADIFRRYGQAFRERCGDSLSALQRQVMTAIERCRTAALGGQIEQCDRCGHLRVCYRSCRNRHCPKCQGSARAAWVDQRRAELLDCPYFHVVFTLPREIAALALQNRRALYNLLFRAAARTLREIAADPKHLGAEIGFFAVLHTWGSNLSFHPHLHCVVPGGGIAPDGDRWIHCRPGFFLPVRVLSRRFRTLFLDQLERAFRHGRLRLSGALAPLADPAAFHSYLRPLRGSEWVVYSKPPFDGPARVLDYVGRYTPPRGPLQRPHPGRRGRPRALPLARLPPRPPAAPPARPAASRSGPRAPRRPLLAPRAAPAGQAIPIGRASAGGLIQPIFWSPARPEAFSSHFRHPSAAPLTKKCSSLCRTANITELPT